MDKARSLVALGILGLIPAAIAQDTPKLGIDNETSWNSKYVWRGLVIDGKSNYQSDNTINVGAFSLNIYNRGRTLKPTMQMGSDEVDFTLGWETTAFGMSLEPILSYYTYPRNASDVNTCEAGLCLSKNWRGLNFFTNHYMDIHAADGAYYGEAGVSWEKKVATDWAAGATVTTGWANNKFNAYNFGVNRRALNAVTGELSLTYHWGSSLYIRPWIGMNGLVDKRLRESVSKPDNAVWGIAFGISK